MSAIDLVISVCRKTMVPCHIVHLSAASALPAIRGRYINESFKIRKNNYALWNSFIMQ